MFYLQDPTLGLMQPAFRQTLSIHAEMGASQRDRHRLMQARTHVAIGRLGSDFPFANGEVVPSTRVFSREFARRVS